MRTFLSGLFARLGSPGDGDPSDDQLLAAFVSSSAEAAFTQIVRRHGAMVHGVCRRVLRNEADADDAFQAVFLVLIRKAGSVRPGNLLGNWLYGVAVNVARKARELNARRRAHELAAPLANPGRESGGDLELHEVIDQELNRLPASYRAAVVACDLQGRTRREAAAQLGWSEGTVASRLARARSLLSDRLTRRGIAVPVAGLASALGVNTTAGAGVPLAVFTGHSELIDTLARETAKSMSTGKLRLLGVYVLIAAALSGIGIGVVITYNPRFVSVQPAEIPDPVLPRTGDVNQGSAAPFTLTNPNRDIFVVSDRAEDFRAFFRRQRVMVAVIPTREYDAATRAEQPSEKLFASDASQNEHGLLNAAYGAYVTLAPVSKPVADLIAGAAKDPGVGTKWSLVFVADPKTRDVWHVVGFTTRTSSAFFTRKEKAGRDDFAPVDLQFHPEK